MNHGFIDREFGRRAFGSDPAAYDAVRPEYPKWVFDLLLERCGLRPHTATFEIGPGTGTATRRLLERGADPLVAVEPDHRLAEFLRANIREEALNVLASAFEDAELPVAGFDLGFSATAFHWLDEESALRKVAMLLRPGGWWAAVWNIFGDGGRPDPFHEATKELLNGPASPAAGAGEIPFGLDTGLRRAALERTGAFDSIEHRMTNWTLVLDAGQTVALYATYSNINVRPDRDAVLKELGRIARDEFEGLVIRNMTTCLYVARRC